MNKFYTGLFAAVLLGFSTVFAQQDNRLYLQSGTVQTEANLESFISSAVPADVFSGYYYRFLQFNSLPTNDQKAAMAKSGLVLMDYLPKNTFMTAIPVRYDRAQLAGFGVRSVIRQEQVHKISRNIIGGFQDWAIREKGTVDLNVQYQGNITLPAALAAAARQGQILSHQAQNRIITLRVSDFSLMTLAAEPWVFFINTIAAPSEKDDTKGRSLHRTNVISSDFVTGRHYDGSGVTVAIADDGFVGPHIDFTGRITNFATGTGSTHGDMTSGICVGAGNLNPTMRGMASGSYLYTFNIGAYPQVVDAVANFSNYGIVIASTSYSQGCNEYTSDTQFGDQLLYENPQLQFVFSAGNNGSGNCGYGAGASWGNITGGYKQGKNVVACGNLDALEVLDPSSSRGPSSDGRIKPDICSNGRDQMSTDENNTYQVGGGTSAASPGVAGIFAQLYQAYKELTGAPNPPAALIKASLLNTAEDIGNPGPDFIYGWGRVNALRALRTLEDNRYLTDSLTQGVTNTHSITVPAGTSQVRVMVYWSDPGGTPAAAPALVNNINMSVADPSSTSWNPWILDPTPNVTSLSTPAVRGVDSLNNMEQVTLDNPAAGTYTVSINGYAIPSSGQRYYLVWEFRSEELTMTYPNGGEGFVPGETEVLRWDGQRNLGSYALEYTSDNGATWNVISASVPQSLQQYSWTVPTAISGAVKVRVSRNGFSDESDTSLAIIGVPSGITVDWACPDSIRLIWNPVTGAAGYTAYMLGPEYMDPVGTSTTNSIVISGTNPNQAYWFSISAITADGNNGRRANAIYKAPGTFSCPLAIDAQVTAVASPGNGTLQDCHDNSTVPVGILLENRGQNPISNIPVNYSLNGGAAVNETYTGTIAPGGSQLFTFVNTIDLSLAGTYTLQVWASYPGDLNIYNDTAASVTTVIGGTLATLPFIEDFEAAALCGTANDCEATVCPIPGGWINEANLDQDDIDFRVSEGPTASAGTGPDVDHTLGTAAGNYVYLEASTCFNRTANLVTPCLDLTTAASPQMTFWYHMYGAAIGELHVDVYTQGGWVSDAIPPITGNQGNTWQQAVLNLTPWAGDVINIRFRAVTGPNFDSDIALDDINVIESSAPPVPAFIVDATSGCTGKVFAFTDQSLNSPNGWQWVFTPNTVSFVNGTTSASQNPQVVFNAVGAYDVELTATNGFGGGTVTQTSLINILPAAAVPIIEDFQSGTYPPAGWSIDDAGGAVTWAEAIAVTGSDGNPTNCPFVDNYDYNNVGAEDALVTFEVGLASATSAMMTFDVAYARYSAQYTDTLRVDISTDCGLTWQPSGYQKDGLTLSTVGDNTGDWAPTAAGEWRNDTIDLSTWVGSNVVIRFVNINGYGNNLYVDNVNIDAAVGIQQPDKLGSVVVYPNPSGGLYHLELRGVEAKNVSYQLSDLEGRLIMNQTVNAGSSYRGLIDLRQSPQGVYLLRLQSESGSRTVKLVKM
ncbi:MAG: S8 family serine peptidase [Bacteroidia bacterium]|nr:S8 family serine peptidase [Bacteroidia bacterium]